MVQQTKCRAWFQLHLSTCIVLMVIAGVILFLNTHQYDDGYERAGKSNLTFRAKSVFDSEGKEWVEILARPSVLHIDYYTRGWPFRMQALQYKFENTQVVEYRTDPETMLAPVDYYLELENETVIPLELMDSVEVQWRASGIVCNVIVALAILGLTAVGCEVLTRRRERRRAVKPLASNVDS